MAKFAFWVLTVAVAFLIGFATYPFVKIGTMDGGLATLVGAAIGAGLTVVGSIWATSYQNSNRSRSFGRLVAESALAIRQDVYILTSLLGVEDWNDNEVYSRELVERAKSISESFELFKQLAPYSDISDFEARRSIYKLEGTIRDNVEVIARELRWLETPTDAVIERARENLGPVTESIFISTFHVANDLGVRRALPTDAELRQRSLVLQNQ